MPTRNKTAGDKWELDCMHKIEHIPFGEKASVVTARNESRTADATGKDLCNTGNYNFQCKTGERLTNYDHQIRIKMPQDGKINVVLQRKTEKSKGGKFMEKGQYAALPMDHFIELLDFFLTYKDRV